MTIFVFHKKIPPYSPLYKRGKILGINKKSPFFKGGFRGILLPGIRRAQRPALLDSDYSLP
jgi:hypothetical protein